MHPELILLYKQLLRVIGSRAVVLARCFFQSPGVHPYVTGVGVLVGVFIGFFVGTSVGVFIGGFFVGTSVGVFVGVFVGVLVGFIVGVFVGVSVGVFIGFFVGTSVGVFTGFFVGALVAVFVDVSARTACPFEETKTATPNATSNATPINRMNLEGDLVNAWNDLPKRARNDRNIE